MRKFIGFLVILVLVVGLVYLGFRFLAPPEVRSAVAAVLPVTVKETVEVPVEKIVTVEKLVEKVVKETVIATPTAAPTKVATPTLVPPTPTLAVPTPTVGVSQTQTIISGTAASATWLSAKEVYDMVYKPCPAGSLCLPLELGEIHKCPGEGACWAIAREKNLEAVIVPFVGVNLTACLQDGWMAEPAERAKYGRTAPATALGSGVPSKYTGFLQGLTLRPCPSVVASAVAAPTVNISPTPAAKSLTKAEKVLVNVHVPSGVAVIWTECNPPEGSALCWAAKDIDGVVKMKLDCAMDGRGVGSDGEPYSPLNKGESNVIAITARPCSIYQAK